MIIVFSGFVIGNFLVYSAVATELHTASTEELYHAEEFTSIEIVKW
jgi:hypothetical protein